jgi:hypothetical protein
MLINRQQTFLSCVSLMKLAEVEILRISSNLFGLFLPPFSPSRRTFVRLREEERRFSLKSVSPSRSLSW